MPHQKKQRYQNDLQLSEYDANTLTANAQIADYFDNVVQIAGKNNAKPCANWVMVDLAAKLNKEEIAILNQYTDTLIDIHNLSVEDNNGNKKVNAQKSSPCDRSAPIAHDIFQ